MTAVTDAAAVVDASRRLTVGQKRAALHVLADRTSYPSMDALAEALALAVLSAEDAASRRVVVVREPGAVYVYGPYATDDTARKVIDAGLATMPGARAAVLPLIATPRSPLTRAQTAAPKRPTKAKVTA